MRLTLLLSLFYAAFAAGSTAVKVLVCTEALCPDCEGFVKNQLVSVYADLGPEIMDLQLVPYGNARLLPNGTALCQHGVGECDANIYELCAISIYPNPADYLPFVQCLAESLPMGGHHDEPLDPKLFGDCATSNGLWWSRIQACHDVPMVADKLVQDAAAVTPSNHTYVPWIEIEGNHLREEEQDFKTEICRVFKAQGGSHSKCNAIVL